MSAFNSLSSDLVEFYDLPAKERAALKVLAKDVVTVGDHAAIGMPLVIGRLKKAGRLLCVPTPNLDFSHDIPLFGLAPNANNVAKQLGEMFHARIKKQNHLAKIILQTGLIETIFKFDQHHFGGEVRDTSFAFDNKIFTKDNLRFPAWHIDSIHRFYELKSTTRETVSRIYTWRPNVTTEFLRNEWVGRRDKRRRHPLVAKLSAAELEYRGAAFDKKPIVKAEIENLTDQLRRKGKVVRARPYEIVLMDNFTPHRTAPPPPGKARLSSFSRIELSMNSPA